MSEQREKTRQMTKQMTKPVSVWNKRALGSEKEELAANYLKANGYQIVERNYYLRSSEIDLIARDGRYLVFIEVKYRKDKRYGYPSEAITRTKKNRILRAAKHYLLTHQLSEYETPCRFDVVSILNEDIQVIKNAF